MAEPPIDSWADPVAAADAAATSLLRALAEGSPSQEAVSRLRRRANEPLVLALAEAADRDDAAMAVRRFRDGLRDSSWLSRLAVDHAAASSFGVVSLGSTTRNFLNAVSDVTVGVPEVFTHSRAIARGLGYLGLPLALRDPASAAVLLIPAQARHGRRVWTTVKAAEAIRRAEDRASEVVVLCHPAATLSPKTRLAYRPDPIIIDTKAGSGVLS